MLSTLREDDKSGPRRERGSACSFVSSTKRRDEKKEREIKAIRKKPKERCRIPLRKKSSSTKRNSAFFKGKGRGKKGKKREGGHASTIYAGEGSGLRGTPRLGGIIEKNQDVRGRIGGKMWKAEADT